MKIEQKLLDIGKRDLESAISLFKEEHFNTSIFQFQQSVEKCVKSYGIITNTIEEKDLQRKISHLPHKVFARLFKKSVDEIVERKNTPILLAEMIPPHQRNIDESERIKCLTKTFNRTNHTKMEDMEKISIDDIESFIVGIENIEKLSFDEKDVYEKIKDDFIKTNNHFKHYFKTVLGEDDESPAIKMMNLCLEHPDDFVPNRVFAKKVEFEREKKIIFINYVWVNLSMITSPHEQKSRYPSTETGISPDEYYNAENEFVKLLPKLFELMKEAITKYEDVYFNEEEKKETSL